MNTPEHGDRPKSSRRVLVGMVAVLVLSISNWQKIENGLRAFHYCMVARLAEWDTWKPRESDGILVTEWSDLPQLKVSEAATSADLSSAQPVARLVHPEAPEREGWGPSLSQSGAKESVASVRPRFPAPIVFERISEDDELDSGVAAMLDRVDDRSTLEPPLPASPRPRSDRVALESNRPAEAGDWVSAAGEASIELRLVLDLCRFADGPGADPTSPGLSTPSQPVLVASNPVDDMFEENPNGYEPDEEDSASAMSSRPPATMAGWTEPFESEDPLLAEWNRWDDRLTIAPEFQAAPPFARRSFEPIALAEDLDQGIAYELNRASEGIRIAPPEAGREPGRKPTNSSRDEIRPIALQPGASPAPHFSTSSGVARRPPSPWPYESTRSPYHDELGRAIALTRDAARAWMDVLAGTTAVRVTSR
jgi:hypothetical protein